MGRTNTPTEQRLSQALGGTSIGHSGTPPTAACDRCNQNLTAGEVAESDEADIVFVYLTRAGDRWYVRAVRCESCGSIGNCDADDEAEVVATVRRRRSRGRDEYVLADPRTPDLADGGR